jgi:hypothetical protein
MSKDKMNFFKSLAGKPETNEEKIDKVIETFKEAMTPEVKVEPKFEPLETTDYAFSMIKHPQEMRYSVVKIGFNRDLKRQTSFELVDEQVDRDSAIESFKIFVARSGFFG